MRDTPSRRKIKLTIETEHILELCESSLYAHFTEENILELWNWVKVAENNEEGWKAIPYTRIITSE